MYIEPYELAEEFVRKDLRQGIITLLDLDDEGFVFILVRKNQTRPPLPVNISETRNVRTFIQTNVRGKQFFRLLSFSTDLYKN